MQTVINKKPAKGIPGEFGSTRPRYSYAVSVATAIEFGKPVGRKSDGSFGAVGGDYAVIPAVFGTPHQHVQWTLMYGNGAISPTKNGTANTLSVGAGTDGVDVIERGEVWIAVPVPTGEVTASTKFANGAKLYVTAAGAYTTTAEGNTLIGTVVIGGTSTLTVASDGKKTEVADVALLRIGF